MSIRRFEPSRAVEVLTPKYGCGYRIGGNLILTAAHLLNKVGSGCEVRDKQSFGKEDAQVVWKAQGLDIALIELPDRIADLQAITIGELPEATAGEKLSFQMYGYPLWARTQREKGSAAGGRQIEGIIYLSDRSPDGLLVLEAERLPPEATSDESEWPGVSGASIVCDGLVVAVQSRHQNPDRPASLEAAPLWAVSADKQWRQLLEKHGISPNLQTARLLTIDEQLFSSTIEKKYLQGLKNDIDRYLSRAIPSLNLPIVQLKAKQTLGAVESAKSQETPSILPIEFFEMLPHNELAWEESTSTDFCALFNRYNGRVLLLGEPGSGKTITLMVFAKECIAGRLKDVEQPLPLIAPIATWDKTSMSLADWLSKLTLLDKNQIEEVLTEGREILLLDGLDELGVPSKKEEEEEIVDPREEFLQLIPANNKILITCRSQDYREISSKAHLNGALTLQPLNDDQKRSYLKKFPELVSLIESDKTLEELTRIPIILSLFTSAFVGLGEKARMLFDLNRGEVRDRIIGTYIKQRFEIENRKLHSQIPFTLDQIYEVLGLIAMQDAGGGGNQNIFRFETFKEHLENNASQFLELTTLLNVLYWETDTIIRFSHMLIRDHFAFNYAQASLTSQFGEIRDRAAWALWQIPDERAVNVLIPVLDDPYKYARGSAAGALGRIGHYCH